MNYLDIPLTPEHYSPVAVLKDKNIPRQSKIEDAKLVEDT